jgi:hypothetical protein
VVALLEQASHMARGDCGQSAMAKILKMAAPPPLSLDDDD